MVFEYKIYSDGYARLFEAMKNKILHLSTSDLKIEHVGSTVVEGLGGKGIIDISIGIKRWKDADEVLAILRKIGFKHFHDIENNNLFVSLRKHCEEGNYHVHISRIGTKRYRKTLAFRDFLREYPREAKKYEKIKREIFKQCKEDRQLYKKLKNEYFVEFFHIFRTP